MQAGLQRLLSGPRMIDRSEFCSIHLRENITEQMAGDIFALAGVTRWAWCCVTVLPVLSVLRFVELHARGSVVRGAVRSLHSSFSVSGAEPIAVGNVDAATDWSLSWRGWIA